MRHKWLPEVKGDEARIVSKWLCACGTTRHRRIEKFYYFDARGKLIGMEPPKCTRLDLAEATPQGKPATVHVYGISTNIFVQGKFGSASGTIAGSVPTRYVTMHVCPIITKDDVYSVAVVTGNFDQKIGNVRLQKQTTEIEWFAHTCDVSHESLSHMLRLICAAMNTEQNAE